MYPLRYNLAYTNELIYAYEIREIIKQLPDDYGKKEVESALDDFIARKDSKKFD